jgi:RNA polymerase sigma-70 factor, ECF subfamily
MGEALQALSPAHREVLELQYHSDLTQTQVAERLGVPIGTVKSRTLYAMRALARELKDRGLVE